ncbi:hypothetical protein HDV57DRAFT_316928 [Trichoderma longibrachiatum]|uniref:Uncharacterized protein n=1 Tax=Trichoderma longibrachiatum ATCC 18648 TaxID=983965 RepID=A0A2T4BZX5_TRILO|nr:hypothetical protein M440DRAFT_1423775 [Trichoderma longibrachiatum ATCC 18648]
MATPPQSAQRPLESSPSSDLLLVTPITPIVGDESKLLDPILQASPLISSATPREDAADQIAISPSGKRPAKHVESLGRKRQRTHLVRSEDLDGDYKPGSCDDSDESDVRDAPALDDEPEVILDVMDLDDTPTPSKPSNLESTLKASELRIFPAAILIGQRLYTPYAEGH